MGASLLGIWGLPVEILEAVAWHHDPRSAEATEFSALTAVHVANVIELEKSGRAKSNVPAGVDLQYLADISMADRYPLWRKVSGLDGGARH